MPLPIGKRPVNGTLMAGLDESTPAPTEIKLQHKSRGLEIGFADGKPYVWTATVESIMAKLSRCRQTLENIQPGCTLPRTRKAKK